MKILRVKINYVVFLCFIFFKGFWFYVCFLMFLFFYIRSSIHHPRLLTTKRFHQRSILFLLLLSFSSLPLPPLIFSSFNGSESSSPPLSLGTGGFGGGRLVGGSPSCVRSGRGGDSNRLGREDSRVERRSIRGFFDCLGLGEFRDVGGDLIDRCPGLGVDD